MKIKTGNYKFLKKTRVFKKQICLILFFMNWSYKPEFICNVANLHIAQYTLYIQMCTLGLNESSAEIY